VESLTAVARRPPKKKKKEKRGKGERGRKIKPGNTFIPLDLRSETAQSRVEKKKGRHGKRKDTAPEGPVRRHLSPGSSLLAKGKKRRKEKEKEKKTESVM